jgi:hypothetical protein
MGEYEQLLEQVRIVESTLAEKTREAEHTRAKLNTLT